MKCLHVLNKIYLGSIDVADTAVVDHAIPYRWKTNWFEKLPLNPTVSERDECYKKHDFSVSLGVSLGVSRVVYQLFESISTSISFEKIVNLSLLT